jgi:hypothetical protein
MISIKNKNNTISSSAVLSNNIKTRRTSLKNRIKEMKQRVFEKNKMFHENDTIIDTKKSSRKSLIPRIRNYVEEATMSKKRKRSLMNISAMSNTSIAVDFEFTKKILSSTIIDDDRDSEEALNSERNLNRLKKSLRKLKKFNHKRLSSATKATDESRRAYGCSGGEIFTSTSTNLRNLCDSSHDNDILKMKQQQQQQHFLNLTKNINIYNDLNRFQSGFTDDAILFNKFNNFGEFKIWFV